MRQYDKVTGALFSPSPGSATRRTWWSAWESSWEAALASSA